MSDRALSRLSPLRDGSSVPQSFDGKSASGTDGWCPRDLKALPLRLWAWAVPLLQHVEDTGAWPLFACSGGVALIPKGDQPSDEALKQRPITVLVALYRLWSSIRFQDLLAWQEEWVWPTLRGGRKGMGCQHHYFGVAPQAEVSGL